MRDYCEAYICIRSEFITHGTLFGVGVLSTHPIIRFKMGSASNKLRGWSLHRSCLRPEHALEPLKIDMRSERMHILRAWSMHWPYIGCVNDVNHSGLLGAMV